MQTQHKLNSVNISRLKCLRDLEISFEGNNVTAILGKNGCGKSTLLQAIYCLYRPTEEQYRLYYQRHAVNQWEEIPDSKFSHFFKNIDGTRWTDSELHANMTWRENARIISHPNKLYKKNNQRWSPRMTKKPVREIYYIGINTCVPAIEKAKRGVVTYHVRQVPILENPDSIIDSATRIMGVQYSHLFYSNETNRLFFNVQREGISSHALALGAGDQRLFTILETLHNAGNYSLVIIDELDLTLHTAAFMRLITEIVRIANNKHLQVVFTTHRQEVMSRNDINVRYLMQTRDKTLCMNDPSAICYEELTGEHEQDLTIWVEDELSKTIVEKILEEEDMCRRAEIRIFGSIENSFTLAGYYKIAAIDTSRLLVVLDGDKYITFEDKLGQLKRTITGNRDEDIIAREEAVRVMLQYNAPNGYAPEKVIHQSICDEGRESEIKNVATRIINPDNQHGFVDDILEQMHWGRDKYYRIIDEFARCPQWKHYTRDIRQWLNGVR